MRSWLGATLPNDATGATSLKVTALPDRKAPTMKFVRPVVIFVAGFLVGSAVPLSQAWQAGRPPFRDAGEQREQMIRELQTIQALLKEQNTILRSLQSKSEPR